jgi:diguanylate cyclase (GGDEF)-like protein
VDQEPTGVDAGGHDDHRPGARRRLSHRTSVWHYLVALALLPSIGVAAIAAFITTERLDDAAAAERIEHASAALRQVDDLREALAAEAGASALADTLALLRASPEIANRAADGAASVPLPQLRQGTDAALATVRDHGTTVTAGSEDGLAEQLAAARRLVDAPASGTDRAERPWRVISAFRGLSSTVAGLERASADAIVTGRYGTGSRAVLKAAAELDVVSRLALAGGDRTASFYLLSIAPPSAVPGLTQELRDTEAAYQFTAAELATTLDPPLSDRWRTFETSESKRGLDQLIGGFASPAPAAGAVRPGLGEVLRAFGTIRDFTDELAGLLTAAVDGLESAAAHDRALAGTRARTAVALTAGLLLLTLLLLLGIGGTLRWRLGDLAAAAQRLSAGRLQPVTVRGPREIALAGEGLNDAVASLQRVTSTAEHLAAGDLTSPELRRPAPGPLGAAVHASVLRVADAIRDRERLQEELAHQATHDSLTGLVNRLEGERLIGAALLRSREEGTLVGLLFVDLDHFKAVNDTHGHHAGDHVLQVTAARMEAHLTGRDVVCRFGGDEFVVLLDPVASESAAIEAGERLVATVGQPIRYDEHELFVGASVGVALAEAGSIDGEELLGRSDGAVYRAKAAGRGGVVAH